MAFLKNKFYVKLQALSSIVIGSMTKLISGNDSNGKECQGDHERVSSTEGFTKMPVTKETVDEMIKSDSVVIFSKTRCPYCKMAKEVFNNLKKKYTAIELDERDDADEIQGILGEITGARTVPRVFLNGECLGGGTDVKKLYDSGELAKRF